MNKHSMLFMIVGLISVIVSGCAIPNTPDTPNRTDFIPTSSIEDKPTSTEPSIIIPKEEISPTDTNPPPELFQFGEASFTRHLIDIQLPDLAAADFNNDGHVDLVAAGDPMLDILLGDGEGGFNTVSQIPGGENPTYFALADLDFDTNMDIVVANHDTDYITVLSGYGDGNFFQPKYSPLHLPVDPHPHAVAVADFDADGYLDLVVDHRNAESLYLLRGLEGGAFETPGIVIEVGGDPYIGMAVGDVNGDGLLDILTPNPGEIGVLINISKGEIAFRLEPPLDADAPFGIDLGDFNGDSSLDVIATSDESSSLVEVYWGDGLGGFTPTDESPLTFSPGAKNVSVGDFDGDGIDDAAVANWQNPEVLVLLGGDNGLTTGYLPGDTNPWGLAAADFNEDGIDDLVIGDGSSQVAVVYLSVAP